MRAGNCVCQEHSFVIAPRNDSGGVLVFEGKWVTMERERNGLLWCVYDGLLWSDGIW